MKRFCPLTICTYLLCFLFEGCIEPAHPHFPAGSIEGYRPVYASLSESEIVFTEARQLQEPGKIHIVSKYLLINEKFKGIHVFDNSNPADPVPVGFLKMVGNTEAVVRNNILYADHLADIVAIDISDWANPRVLSRTKQESWAQKIPPGNNRTYFECVDESKGIVIGWELVTIVNPKCFR